MTDNDLEAPPGIEDDWDSLYIARESEVLIHRPIYSGDVFQDVSLRSTSGEVKNRFAMVIQHPCAMRPDGVHLADRILVARVHKHPLLPREQWTGSGKLMPLPHLLPSKTTQALNQAGYFDDTYHVHPDDLIIGNRIACLSEIGTYLLLQRWVYHSSRVVVPKWKIEEFNSHLFAEADLLENWCEIAIDNGADLTNALDDANNWLGESPRGTTRRLELRDVGMRSSLNREAKSKAKDLYQAS